MGNVVLGIKLGKPVGNFENGFMVGLIEGIPVTEGGEVGNELGGGEGAGVGSFDGFELG